MASARRSAIASFVPRIVAVAVASAVDSDAEQSPRPHPAAVLFVDAVSFTSRVAALVDSGPRGVERLTALMDAQYAPQLRAIAEHGGEVVRFVGDAVLAVIPAEGRTLAEVVAAAAACGLAIQAAPRPPMPDGAPLAVRVVVTAGAVSVLGEAGPASTLFVLAGDPLRELAEWAQRSGSSEVLLAPSASRLAGAGVRGRPRGQGLVVESAPAVMAPAVAGVPAFDEEVLRRFVPRPVLDRIDSGHLDWLAELRRASAVFAAIRGLSDAEAPGTLAECRALAERHEVFLKELVLDDKGWTLVALTGVPPFAGANDAARAVRFARDVVLLLRARGLLAGAGVATGRACCAAIGSEDKREYAVTGALMNLASRLSQVASDGQVLCDAETSHGVRGQVALEPLAPVVLKGLAAQVPVSAVGRDLVAARTSSGLVGREVEQALLASAAAAARAGNPSPAILLEGEAGIGKSRLGADLLAVAEGLGLSTCVGAAQSVSRASPYHPWRDAFAAVLRALGATDPAALASALGSANARLAPLLEPLVLLGLADNDDTAQLAGQARARRTRDVCVGLLRSAAERRPTLLLLEDLHWSDPASWDLVLDVVAARIPGLLLVATSRPEGLDDLAAFERAGGVRRSLSGLGRESTASLLAASFHVQDVDAAVVDRVHLRAAGNPLFADQLAMSLGESRAVTIEAGRCAFAPGVDLASVALPATVEGAIQARLDRLSSGAQLALKVASVIGSELTRAQMVHAFPRVEGGSSVDELLAVLTEAQLVLPLGEQRFRFRHELVRDVAYQTMLFEQRRVLHAAMAAWFEREHTGDLGPHLAVVAHHHRVAGNVDRAADYLERASTHAFRFGLPRQSVTLGLEGAGLLGVTLPTEPAAVAARIGQLVAATMKLVGGRAPHELLALPTMSDPAKVRTTRVLLELAPFTFQAGRPDLYTLVGLTLLQLVLEHGNAAPDVYSTYSVVHRAIHGDARGAHAWSELAMALDARQGGQARARVAFVHDWFHAHWLRPLRESVARSLEAAEAGLAAGDVLFGCYNLSGHLIYAAAAGRPLDEVADLARAQLARNGRRVVNAAFHCVHEMQVARAIAGRTRSPLSMSDDDVDEERDVASITSTDFYNQIGYYLVSRVKLHALFGDAAGALRWADKLGPLQAAIAGQVAEIDLVFYRTLAELDEGLLDRARAGMAEVARWMELCPANFEHLAAVLRGAVKAREGDREGALASLTRAAALAEAQGFVQHAAMAHERASRVDPAGDHRAAALAAYRRWGALAKVEALSASHAPQ